MRIDTRKKSEIADVSKIIECIVFLPIIAHIVWLNIYDIIGIFKISLQFEEFESMENPHFDKRWLKTVLFMGM